MNNDGKNIIGDRLRDRRRAAGMDMRDFTEALKERGVDITVSTLCKIELKNRKVTDYELLAIAGVLGVSVEELLGVELSAEAG